MSLLRTSFALLAIVAGVAPPTRAAELERLLPDDADLVISVNLRQILDSGIMKKHVLPELDVKFASEARKLVGLLGLNPVKEVASFTVAFPGNGDPNQWVGIVRGEFDVARLQGYGDSLVQSRPNAVAVHQHDRTRIYEDLTRKDQRGVPRFFALLDKEILIASPTKACVVEASRRVGQAAARANPGLADLVARQDGKQSIWVASVASDSLKKNWGQQAGLAPLAGKLLSFGGGVTIGDDVKLNVRIQMSDPKTARDMRQQLEALKAIAVLAISVNEDLRDYAAVLVDALNGLTFSQEQTVVGADLIVPGTLIEKGIQAGKNPSPKPGVGAPR